MHPRANMKPRAELHQSAPSPHRPHNVEGRDDLARSADSNAVAQARANQRVAHERKALDQGRADAVEEFQRCSAGAAFFAVNNDVIRCDTGFDHRFDDGEKLPRVPDTQLEADRLTARLLAKILDEGDELEGGGKSAVPAR